MGKIVDSIPDHCIAQIQRQHMFWVATAPLNANGHVNLSPKGLEDTFHIIDKNTVWYEDLTGSGNETVSHLRENGRITILFNMFEGPPGLIRLFGKGVVHEFGTAKYNELIPAEKRHAGSRCIIMIDVHKVGMSCGYQVPFYEFVGHRTRLLEWGARLEKLDICADSQSKRSDKGMRNYWATTNEKSIDGLPGMLTAMNAPDSFLDGERLGPFKKDNESAKVKTKARSCAIDMKNIWAFSLGVLATAAYVKLAL